MYLVVRGKLDFINGIIDFPGQPGKALHKHTHMCQCRIAQAEKKICSKEKSHSEH